MADVMLHQTNTVLHITSMLLELGLPSFGTLILTVVLVYPINVRLLRMALLCTYTGFILSNFLCSFYCLCSARTRELHGDGDDGITAVTAVVPR